MNFLCLRSIVKLNYYQLRNIIKHYNLIYINNDLCVTLISTTVHINCLCVFVCLLCFRTPIAVLLVCLFKLFANVMLTLFVFLNL